MKHLPSDFAEDLARVIEPSQREAAARIIQAAGELDDDGLRKFLDLFAERIRVSAAPVTHAELQGFLLASKKTPPPSPGA
jgi:hypothetical protein